MYIPRNPNIPLTFEQRVEREVERRWQLQIADEIALARRTIRRLKAIGLYAEYIALDNALWSLWFRDDERVRLALAVFEAAARLSWLALLDKCEGADTYCDNCGGNLADGGIHWFQTAPDTWICQPNIAEARADATEDDWKVS